MTLRPVSLFLILSASCAANPGGDRPDDPGKADTFGDAPDGSSSRVCPPATEPGLVSCHARVATSAEGLVPYAQTPTKGLTPADLASAYELDGKGGDGETIAIVDAYDAPNAESDLAAYRKHFKLPACTRANGCFRKVNEKGKASPLPSPDPGWSQEIALDLEMASAACPKCDLLLVEADAATLADLGASVDTAAKLGSVVSCSFGGPEGMSADEHFHHAGVQIFVSAGDSGYGVEYPAASRFVTAVGGTSLKKSKTARGWSERAWGTSSADNGGTGSGCSDSEAKPAWQHDDCPTRAVADVSAVAIPATGVAVYETYAGHGWASFGGTSASAPLVAGIFAATGHAGDDASLIYVHHAAFHDVTTGLNGACGTYLCKGGKGYDGPTGNGTPNGAALVAIANNVSVSMGGTCEHNPCLSGAPLADDCDPCASTVCAADSFCCDSSWDDQCASEAADVCGMCG